MSNPYLAKLVQLTIQDPNPYFIIQP
jgi:hypothetical protein